MAAMLALCPDRRTLTPGTPRPNQPTNHPPRLPPSLTPHATRTTSCWREPATRAAPLAARALRAGRSSQSLPSSFGSCSGSCSRLNARRGLATRAEGGGAGGGGWGSRGRPRGGGGRGGGDRSCRSKPLLRTKVQVWCYMPAWFPHHDDLVRVGVQLSWLGAPAAWTIQDHR